MAPWSVSLASYCAGEATGDRMTPTPFGTIARLTARTAFAEPGCSPTTKPGTYLT
jgi:hypothetical protein